MTRRALVLGGGGLTGIAWEWGVLTGLAEAGVDLGDADLVIGTSAGSVVGAQVANGLAPRERYEAQLLPPDGELAAALGRGMMFRFALTMVGSRAPQRVRQRIGRIALSADTGVTEADRVGVIESRLPVREWPADTALHVTAVDTETGAFRIFDATSGVPLVRAVAASCAVPGVWPPVTIDGRRYMDGGMRSAANADLASGYERIVVLAPIPRGIGPMPGTFTQVEALRRESEVALLTPDPDAVAAFGKNPLDPIRRAAAARAGMIQSSALVEQVRKVWE
ncbi:patatin-like phospholipase family protein [Actinophytocola oryzae]|uniref:NTE family protein n=1 Tax=Actinophytocola oryzae TaxID=502181 RepID=A0A4R7VUN4_9PSEU|nr:patatin-like phospholipase family protein [Actinophytocola oryzae]TDV53542.1 NTE family protein [Actinophytocola oryzae]